MKTKLINLAIIVNLLMHCKTTLAQEGIPYYDALALSEIYKSGNPYPELCLTDSSVNAILRHYYTMPYLGDAVKKNPFLSVFFEDMPCFYSRHSEKPSIQDKVALEGLWDETFKSIAGVDVTTIADGMAKFIVKRSKEELNANFFSEWKSLLKKYPDIQTLFPKTAVLLNSIDNDVYDYQSYLQNLREAFKSDIHNLNENLPGLIPNHPQFFNDHFGIAASLRSSCYIANALKNNIHPGYILENYPLQFLMKDDTYFDKNWSGSIQLLQLISESFREINTARQYWVNYQKIKELVNNKEAFRIYLGLIYQQAKSTFRSIPFEEGNFITVLDRVNFELDYPSYKSYILNFAAKSTALNEAVVDLNHNRLDSGSVELYGKYMSAGLDLLEYATAISEFPHISITSAGNLHEELKLYFSLCDNMINLLTNINRKNYFASVNDLLQIYAELYKKANGSTDPEISPEMQSKLAQYGSFMASIATAKTSDEVENVIEKFALPRGSAKTKKIAPYTISLNAYLGGYCGYEQISYKDPSLPYFKCNSAGLTAPLGISFSRGYRPHGKNENAWSTSLFFSFVDIGSIAAFRFKDSTTSQLPSLQLKDILAPGAALSIGLPRVPISINMGAQIGPNLRNVKNTVYDYSGQLYIRYFISLCVDIPIFNLYTKSAD